MDGLYSVSELSKMLGISPRTIRFYEDKGLVSPGRAGNSRVYTDKDKARMIIILRGKSLGFSLREIQEYLNLYKADPHNLTQTRNLLERVRERIAQLKKHREALEITLNELEAIERESLKTLGESQA